MSVLNGSSPIQALSNWDAGQPCGLITMWDLSGAIDYEELTEAWKREGLPEMKLLNPPSSQVAFRRALRLMVETDEMLAPLRRRYSLAVEDVQVGKGVFNNLAIVGRCTTNAGVHHVDTLAQFKLGTDEVVELVYANMNHEIDTAHHVRNVNRLMQATRRDVQAQDVGAWLCNLCVAWLRGIVLREHGGVYFIPEHNVAFWRNIRNALMSVSRHSVHLIPAAKGEDVARTVLAAMQREADATIREIQQEADNRRASGKRVDVGFRATKINNLVQKVRGCEELFSTHLEGFKTKLEELTYELERDQLLVDEPVSPNANTRI